MTAVSSVAQMTAPLMATATTVPVIVPWDSVVKIARKAHVPTLALAMDDALITTAPARSGGKAMTAL